MIGEVFAVGLWSAVLGVASWRRLSDALVNFSCHNLSFRLKFSVEFRSLVGQIQLCQPTDLFKLRSLSSNYSSS
jgi:hypothetical protein